MFASSSGAAHSGWRQSGVVSSVGALRDDHIRLWTGTFCERPPFGPRTGRWQKRRNAHRARGLIDDVCSDLERLPRGELQRREWREGVRQRVQDFGRDCLGWPDGFRRLAFADAFFDSAVAFARAARSFDRTVELGALGQALRNVWIGNSLQMLLGMEIALRPGLFAYSMLYPVTDNWLDDVSVASSRKLAFNTRFGRRLAGERLIAGDAPETAAFRLVEMIESELPHRQFPGVYGSLRAIQDAQARSLKQHQGAGLGDAELLAISVEKGGTSVLADLNLVAPTAGPLERRFAFGYGVFLQLLDDLQDIEEDLAAGHETLFTRAARRGPLDDVTARVARFMDLILDGAPIAGGDSGDRLDLIRRNCRALLVSCVAESGRLFSRGFRRHLENEWPLTLRAQRGLRRRLGRRWRGIATRLGSDWLDDALGALAGGTTRESCPVAQIPTEVVQSA